MINLAPIVEMLKRLHETTNPDQAFLVVRSESEAEKEIGRIQSSYGLCSSTTLLQLFKQC